MGVFNTMHDHNLDDLIIDNIDPETSKTKSVLTIVALAIVVLIVAIILTKIVLKDPNDQLLYDENYTEMFDDPDLILQPSGKSAETGSEKAAENLSLGTPTANKKPELPFSHTPVNETPTPQAKKQDQKKSTQEEARIAAEKAKEARLQREREAKLALEREKAAKQKALEEKRAEEQARLAKEREELAAQKALEEKRRQEQLRKETLLKQKRLAEEKARREQLAKEAAAKKSTTPKHTPQESTHTTYYIQVGYFSKMPSSQFLSVIKRSGFDYLITPPNAKGNKKLLIGPYATRAEADRALVRVRDRINKSAFILKK